MSETLTVNANNIEDKSLQELRDMLIEKEVEFRAQSNKKSLIKLIKSSDKFTRTKRTDKPHPKYGEYISCIVHPQSSVNRNTDIYIGLNAYSIDIKPRMAIKLPKGVIKFIKGLTEPQYRYDKSAITENGNLGAHVTDQVPKYVVELLLEDDE